MRAALAVVLLALVVRLAVVWSVGTETGMVDDEWAYRWSTGAAHLWTRWWPPILECRPPGYPLFLRALGVARVGEGAILTIQAVIGALTLVPLMAFARRWVGAPAALTAGVLLALYPTLVSYAALFMSETLFLLPLVLFFDLLSRPQATRRMTAAAGVVLGTAILVRSTLLPFVPLLLLWTLASGWWPRPERLPRAVILALSIAAPILPWTARNAIVYHELIPIDCYSMSNLWQGNNPDGWNIKLGERYYAHSDSPGAREAFAREQALAYIRQQPLDYPVQKLGRVMAALLIARHDTGFFVQAGRFGPLPPPLAARLLRLENLLYVMLVSAGLAGFILAAPDPRRTLVGLFAASVVLAHVITFALPRYRMPLLPFCALFAGVALCRPRPPWAPTPGRWLLATVAVAGFLGVALRSGL